jgi:ribosomal protein S18 acetylase RimI-like enzyme
MLIGTRRKAMCMDIRPLFEADRRAAARVYVTGLLDEEVRPLMPRHPAQAESVFADLIQPNGNSWVAESEDGEVIGLALCQQPVGPPLTMTSWSIYRRHLPCAAALRAKIVANYLYRVELDADTMFLQSLVVSHVWEGRGVGQALVRFVCDEARRRGYVALTLNVVEGNDRARRLYEHLGFLEVRTSPSRLYRPLVGWGAVSYMEKRL